MIYVILYSIIAPGTPTGMTGGLYYGWAYDLGNAQKKFDELELTPELFRKELWTDDKKGCKRLIKYEKFHPKEVLAS